MTQMESPKRKLQKKNDYQRHKLFRKIKRRRKAQAEAEQQIAEKQLRKKLKLPKFGDGKEKVNLDNAHFDKDGNLVDNTTGTKYTATTNDVIITPNTKYFYDPYSSANNYFDPSDLKYSSAVTFDDNGNIIPLSKRDNFNFNDLRYAVIPTITGGYAVRSNYDSGKDIHIKKSKRGTFTKAAKQHGMSVQSFANKVLRNPSKYSAAMRKKANFAHNAASWKH